MVKFSKHIYIISILFIFIICIISTYAYAVSVSVIAPSVSTSIEARKIINALRWNEAYNIRDADAILVVCRSSLLNPLNYYYDSYKDLSDDAEMQLNISGINLHIYVYTFDNNLRIIQRNHKYYKYDGF